MTHDAVCIRAVREATHPPVEGGGCLEQSQRYGATIVDQTRAKRAARMPVQMALSAGMLMKCCRRDAVLALARRSAAPRTNAK